MRASSMWSAAAAALLLAACTPPECVDAQCAGDAGNAVDAGSQLDPGGHLDGGPPSDAGSADGGIFDAGVADAGQIFDAAGAVDAGSSDAGTFDAGAADGGAADAGGSLLDAGSFDAGAVDAGSLSSLNDEFDSSATSTQWSDLYPAKHQVLDVATSRPGFLTIVPVAQNFTGWYSEYEGPLYFKNVTGNFVAETSVVVGTASDRTMTPTLANSYCQGGFVVRAAQSVPFQQRWIMYNLGYQDNAVAREIKTTVPSVSGTTDSLSTLNLNNVVGAANQGRLRVCRIGSVFRFYFRHPADTGWTEETFRSTGPAPTRVFGNGVHPSRADFSALSFDRPDLPATLQVGLYVGNYAPPAGGVRGEFDYVRFGTPTVEADCLQNL